MLKVYLLPVIADAGRALSFGHLTKDALLPENATVI
jgi:hypothetical protein